jgi:hypothetical protein
MPANTIYEHEGEMKIGTCDVAVFEWFSVACPNSTALVTPFGNDKPERIFKRQIRYIVRNRINNTPQGLDWCSRIITPAENAENFSKAYLGFLTSLRFPTPAIECHSNLHLCGSSCRRA